MEHRKIIRRAAIVVILAIVLALLSASSLTKLQVAEGDDYLAVSESSIYSTEEIPAVRGDIYDRYGVLLVGNVVGYDIGLSSDFVDDDELANATLLELTTLCVEQGRAYNDHLPINADGTEYADTSSNWQSAWDSYVTARKWDSGITSLEAMENMRKRYGLSDDYTPAEARLILGVRYELELRKIVNMDPYVFAEDVDIDFISMVRERSLDNVEVKQKSERSVCTDYAAHILGYTGYMSGDEYSYYSDLGYDIDEKVGKDGVEAACEVLLHGLPGTRIVSSDTQGNITGVSVTKEAAQGDSIYLTVDIGMQEVAERSLASTIESLRRNGYSDTGGNAEGGAAVVIDVKSGEIMALASYPTFDLSSFSENYADLIEAQYSPLYNRATLGTYEPGSTFKMVTATAALESGAITTATQIEDKGVYAYYADAGYSPKCWVYTARGATHGIINVSQALSVSCNYFFYEAGRLTGMSIISDYAAQYGLGQPTGIEINESTGMTATPDTMSDWYPSYTIQAAIGQLSTYTPLQIANYVATVANGGTRYSAHLVKTVTNSDTGAIVDSGFVEVAQNVSVSDSNLFAVQDGMRMCTSEGTASAYMGDYPVAIASKTGSAQTGGDTDNAVFVCYAPYDDPQIAIAVVVEKGGKGSLVTQIARDILDYYFENSDRTTSSGVNVLIK